MEKETALLLTQSKSMIGGLLLAWFFGGLGIFYVSIIGGVVFGGIELLMWMLTIFTAGLGYIVAFPILVVTHILALLWVYRGVKKHNNLLITGLTNSTSQSESVAVNTTSPVTATAE